MGICTTLWGKALGFLVFNDDSAGKPIFTDEELLEEAGMELNQARNLFTQVEDPEMIDYAIFQLTAAEQRYDYLLRRIKAQRGYSRKV